MKKILIIVPVYNEQNTISNTINLIKESVNTLSQAYHFQILVINDCSTDNSHAEIIKTGVSYIKLPLNLGIGGAMQSGFMYAYENDFDVAVQIDGDGQHNPNQMKLLLDQLESGNDIILGSRFLEETGYIPSIPRQIGMRFSSFIIKFFFGLTLYDTTSGFRANNRNAIKCFYYDYPKSLAGTTSLIIALSHKLKIKEVSVKMNTRAFGKSSITFNKAFFYPLKLVLAILATILRKK
ncbi:MAG: glycosyltransferase family 2 protein [Bacteriovoracaceae bacterium]